MSYLTKNWFFFDEVIRRRPVTAPMLARIHERLFIQITDHRKENHTHIYVIAERKNERKREKHKEDNPLTQNMPQDAIWHALQSTN
jgi:hypothetical protein